jgi:hypothetical protein
VSVWSSTQHAVVVDTLRIEGRSELFLLRFFSSAIARPPENGTSCQDFFLNFFRN